MVTLASPLFEQRRQDRARWRWSLAEDIVTLLERYPNGLRPGELRAKLGYRHKPATIFSAVFHARHYLGVNIVTENPRSRFTKYRIAA